MRAITVASMYTDKVDTEAQLKRGETKRNMAVVKEVLAALRGFVVALDLPKGAELLKSGEFAPYAAEIAGTVEVSRRYKVMNPDMLRQDYLKLLYLIQDAALNPECRDALGFDIIRPVVTVADRAQRMNVQGLLEDPRLPLCITPVPRIRDMRKLNIALRHKDKTVAQLVKDHARASGAKEDDVEVLVRSLNDANNFAEDNTDAAGELLALFRKHFARDAADAHTRLDIETGAEGSRLTHSHGIQFDYVTQSLALWCRISKDMFRLWLVSESDMLDPENPYVLRSTGQGVHRVQPAPRLWAAVNEILQATKRDLGQWVGSEKIHLGDDQVPNAYFFIEKYAQISRIVVPILRTVAAIETMYDAPKPPPGYKAYIDSVYRTPERAQLQILRDFFRHGFDGSGGDNMEDAGSCVDGRLTSAWNWCNTIREKPFYPLFLLAGFQSFDGDLTV
jgi:hypothetical protein